MAYSLLKSKTWSKHLQRIVWNKYAEVISRFSRKIDCCKQQMHPIKGIHWSCTSEKNKIFTLFIFIFIFIYFLHHRICCLLLHSIVIQHAYAMLLCFESGNGMKIVWTNSVKMGKFENSVFERGVARVFQYMSSCRLNLLHFMLCCTFCITSINITTQSMFSYSPFTSTPFLLQLATSMFFLSNV